MTNKIFCVLLITLLSLSIIAPAMAEVGITDGCQQSVKELEQKIKENKSDYTAESRRKAHAYLLKAKTNRLNPIKCRENVLKAREDLRKGKRERKKDEKEKDKKRKNKD